MATTLTCSGCAAPVEIRSRASVFAVCPYCRSTLVRQDIRLGDYGHVAEVPIAWSPLQVGTEGQADGRRFTLLGRLWQRWADGFWNEWYALFDDGREGWLAEAQGFYSLCFAEKLPKDLPEADALQPGQEVWLTPERRMVVVDRKHCVCVGVEGELPFPAQPGREALSIDLSQRQNDFGCIEFPLNAEPDGRSPRVYVGRYWDFDALQFQGLRALDGWER